MGEACYHTETKIKVYRAVVLTSLLYGCETWTPYRRHERQINHFHLRCLRSILHIRWQDKVPDTDVLEQADISNAITMIHKAQLRLEGHVCRTTASQSKFCVVNFSKENAKSADSRSDLRKVYNLPSKTLT